MPSILISTKNFDLIESQIFLVPITEINILGVGDTPSMKDLLTFFKYLGLSICWLQIGRVLANFKKVDGESDNYHVKTTFKIRFGGQDRWNVAVPGPGVPPRSLC